MFVKQEVMVSDLVRRILLVEDNIDLRRLYKRAITYAGYQVYEAGNGREALDLLHNPIPKPDLIILDLMMPVMDGWAFLREREHDASIHDLPVVVCSATDQVPSGVPSMRKPVDIDSLVEALDRHFNETRGRRKQSQ